MLPYFVLNHFQIGSLRIYTWGFFVGLGFCVGYFWALWRARGKNIKIEIIPILAIAIFFGAALGSRLFFLLQNPAKFFGDVSLLWRFSEGGSMIWGGILGAIFLAWVAFRFFSPSFKKEGWGGFLFSEKSPRKGARPPRGFSPLIPLSKGGEGVKDNNFWFLADFFTLPMILGIIIGRVGCFLLNDHQGAPTNLPWGILWPDGLVRHPVVLYEILALAGLFILLWLAEKKDWLRRGPLRAAPPSSGLIFLSFLLGYALIRFFLDFLRVSTGPLADPQWFGLFASQWISIIIIIGVLAIFYSKLKNQPDH